MDACSNLISINEHHLQDDGGAAARAECRVSATELDAAALLSVIFGTTDGVLVVRPDQGIIFANPAAQALFGRSLEELMTWPFAYPANQTTEEIDIVRPDGRCVTAEVRSLETRWHGEPALVITLHDISRRKRLEVSLRQAMKMEALGRLAGAISHDFNNLLTSVLCDSGAFVRDLPERSPHRRAAERIYHAATRASELTSKLLAFSRKKVVAAEPCDLASLLREREGQVRRRLPSAVGFELVLPDRPIVVDLPVMELSVAIDALIENAIEAMPSGGQLTVSLDAVQSGGDEILPDGGVRAARLCVRDTGVGMDEKVRQHIFEPFFTTKRSQPSAGLGLSALYGLVEQAGGRIEVETAPGRGAMIEIRLPLSDDTARVETHRPRLAGPRECSETVFVVEDDEAIREIVEELLLERGLAVKSFADPCEAMRVLRDERAHCDVLITDVLMPGLTGRELATAALERNTGLQVLFISGFTHEETLQDLLQREDCSFVAKPFAPDRFVAAVEDRLRAAQCVAGGAPAVRAN